jgi:hypothetical protein
LITLKALRFSYVKLRVFTQPTYPKTTLLKTLTPSSPSKFLMAAFVRVFAQKMTAEICPLVLLIVGPFH